VERFGKYGKKSNLKIVKKYGKYRRKASWIVKNMENTEERQVE
jgi:hypothetical protein